MKNFPENYIESPLTKLDIAIKPLVIWADTTNKLDKFYKRPEINLTDTPDNLERKNTMRHITGLARTTKAYHPIIAEGLGYIKEGAIDFTKDFLFTKDHKIKSKTFKDTVVDLQNNRKGINYIKNNPNANLEDIMQFAYKESETKPNYENISVPRNGIFKYLMSE